MIGGDGAGELGDEVADVEDLGDRLGGVEIEPDVDDVDGPDDDRASA